MSKIIESAPRNFRPWPFEYHQRIELEVETLTNEGHGLGRIDNWVVFVAFALPGEKIVARVFRNHRNYSEADLVEICSPSPHRIEPLCPLFGECGGCQFQNLEYAQQLAWKKRQVEELLAHMAGIEFAVRDVVPSPRAFGYRSKITPHFQKPRRETIDAIGFLRSGSGNRIIDVPACPLASEAINAALPEIRAGIRRNAASYRKGATVLLRDSGGEVITDPVEIACEKVGDLTFAFTAGDFFQNNPHILPAFTGYVAAQASAGGTRFLLDAYCGSGLFCLTAARNFERAAGIEISETAVAWAERNRDRNGIRNVRFHCGDAHAIFAGIDYPPAETSVVIDPPRKGCDVRFLEQLLAFGPRRVIYVSCNPATQMRDLSRFHEHGEYTLREVQPFDLFPQTKHLECVMTLEKTS